MCNVIQLIYLMYQKNWKNKSIKKNGDVANDLQLGQFG